ncbi:hypothetical protein B0H14DRAFT_584624 [Mycena olivaceomarginata]|nr:hypothetical protein B0H14DRAFT_584624 [Mycena olivaceomarginata]
MGAMDYVRPTFCGFAKSRLDAIQLIAGSRQLFAFSRDQGFPLSGLLYNINTGGEIGSLARSKRSEISTLQMMRS